MNTSILIFDMDDKIRQHYKKELETEGYRVFTTKNGVEAIRLIRAYDIKLIVMEIVFPNCSGPEYLDAFVNLEQHPKIIINSDYSAYQFNFRLWAAEAFVTKSSDLLELKKAIKLLLKKSPHLFGKKETAMGVAA